MSSLLFFIRSGDQRDLHSFPTRRSSDLDALARAGGLTESANSHDVVIIRAGQRIPVIRWDTDAASGVDLQSGDQVVVGRKRSEEHTSELQSRRDLVCRLLLEKKK